MFSLIKAGGSNSSSCDVSFRSMLHRTTRRLSGFAILATLGAAPRARAEGREEFFIWYRSTDGCPDGDAFLQRLEARGVRGHLARVGDAVDFVVTMGAGQEGAQGLLERQTTTGTVAVRRLDAADCDQIADGIALILAMASESATARRESAPPEGVEPAPRATPAAPAPARDTGASVRSNERQAPWSVGAQGGVLTGVTPAVLPEATVFVQLEPWAASTGVFRGTSFRAYAFGGTSSREEPNGTLSAWIVGGRLEGCPIALGSSAVSVSPCVGLDLGTVNASKSGANATTDQGFWGAVEASARLSVRVAERVSIEAQTAAVMPFERYQFTSEQTSEPLYVASVVGLNAVAGLGVRLP